jgi:hypothetical protein
MLLYLVVSASSLKYPEEAGRYLSILSRIVASLPKSVSGGFVR